MYQLLVYLLFKVTCVNTSTHVWNLRKHTYDTPEHAPHQWLPSLFISGHPDCTWICHPTQRLRMIFKCQHVRPRWQGEGTNLAFFKLLHVSAPFHTNVFCHTRIPQTSYYHSWKWECHLNSSWLSGMAGSLPGQSTSLGVPGNVFAVEVSYAMGTKCDTCSGGVLTTLTPHANCPQRTQHEQPWTSP